MGAIRGIKALYECYESAICMLYKRCKGVMRTQHECEMGAIRVV